MRPDWNAFLHADAHMIAPLVPASVMYLPGGTRRQAALAGIQVDSEEYPQWSRTKMMDSFHTLFRHGFRHVLTTCLQPTQMGEVGHYRTNVMRWMEWGLAGPEALDEYKTAGWRVRLIGVDEVDELAKTRQRLIDHTDEHAERTLWYVGATTGEDHWLAMIKAAQGASSRGDVIRNLYGEDIPAAKLCVSFGKPVIDAGILPLLLTDDTQAYWTQQPGYALTDAVVRSILYDMVYHRNTWIAEKSPRYLHMEEYAQHTQRNAVLGLGQRLGSFWYPEISE